MKKIFIYTAIACGIAFIACNKDNDSTPATASNGSLVASGMKVGYGTKVNSSAPASSTSADAPMLEQVYDYQNYYAIGGRYIVLYPHLYKGDASGYYVTITGSDSYFKIDYTTAYNLRKSGSKHSSMKGDDYNDSSIVIKLPAGLSTDTFSIRYAAYDASNNVSNYINAIIHVTSDADSASNSKLAGKWRFNKQKNFYSENWGDSTIYNVDKNNYYDNFACVDGHLQYWNNYTDYERISKINTINANQAQDFVLGAGNQFSYHYQQKYRELNWELSGCDSLVYENYDTDYTITGGFNYNAASKTVTLIYDGNGERGIDLDQLNSDNTISNLYAHTYTVTSVTSKSLVLFEKRLGEGLEGYYYEFLKQ
ncbi:hypothetical protein SAMN05421788_102106 [Filimonas lacunae]|uniref:Uncharacterized protein n=1 Tax=Filimonas lacunae TaxID=477680 RepID=A0A173MIE8_9BACT|nr:hypothetical protein [Filimonas lacunae]BAV07270.1 hypothetical protein FLA_3293 [Filimonas lacunae]SIS92246.1 hypothetical protein SAMN05421788_102106 [Filimonas lacunae]